VSAREEEKYSTWGVLGVGTLQWEVKKGREETAIVFRKGVKSEHGPSSQRRQRGGAGGGNHISEEAIEGKRGSSLGLSYREPV